MKLGNAVDVLVGDRPVKLLDENPRRRVVNIWPGEESHVWFGGDKNVKPNTIGNRIPAGTSPVEIKSSAEIWVVRAPNTSGLAGYSEEFVDG